MGKGVLRRSIFSSQRVCSLMAMDATNLCFTNFDATFLPLHASPMDESFSLGAVIGSGAQGIVRVSKDKHTHELFACKSIHKALLSTPAECDSVIREIRIMRRLASLHNVVSLHNVYEDDACVHILMELCHGGDLTAFLKLNGGSLPEFACAAICKSLAQTLKECHERGIVHRDVKPGNILLRSKADLSSLKLADFGSAASFSPGERITGMAGTISYMAPEMLDPKAGGYSWEVDVWSLGVLLFRLLSGQAPWRDRGGKSWIRRVNVVEAMETYPWTCISKSAQDLICRMLSINPSTRITTHEILLHPWILQLTSATPNNKTSSLLHSSAYVKLNHPCKMTIRDHPKWYSIVSNWTKLWLRQLPL